MKNKSLLFRPAQRRAFALPLAFTLALAGAAQADTIYWDGTTPSSWGTVSSWSTNPDAVTLDPGAVPGATDDAIFNISTANSASIITLGSDRAAQSLTFNNTGTTTFRGNSSGTTARSLTIGSGGITSASGAGTVVFQGFATGTDGSVNLVLSGSQSIANNSSNNISIGVANTVATLSGSGSPTLTNAGTGTGRVQVFAAIQNNVTKIVQNSATSELWLRSDNVNFTGDIDVLKGVLNIGQNNNNLGTGGTLTLGNSAGGSDAATLYTFDEGTRTFNNAIVLASNTTGPLTIAHRDDGGTNTHTFTGGITGNNHLTIESRAHDGGVDDKLTFSTGALNNVGTITHIGDASGDMTINSVIGTNVTGVTQNSATSRMVLGGTNTYTSTTTVQAGTLALSSTGSINSSTTIDVKSGATFDVSQASNYTVGTSQTLTGAGTVVGDTLIDGTLAPGNGLGTLTFTDDLTLDSLSNLNFQLNPLNTGVGSNINDLSIVNGNFTLDGLLNVTASSGNFAGVTSGIWRLFNYDGALTDIGLTLSSMPVLDLGYSWSLDTATPNQVNLTIIPEPGAALLGGLGLIALLRRRR